MTTTKNIVKTKWLIDFAQSEIAFKVSHFLVTHVKGAFKVFDATIFTTGKDFTTAAIDVWLDTSSVTTGDAERDAYLKSPDFFDSSTFRQISFKADSIKKTVGEGILYLRGHLTIKGIRKSVKFPVQFGGILDEAPGKERAYFSITGKINRSDWKLVWNAPIKTGGLMVSDKIKISCKIELTNAGSYELAMDC
jgi:polyisoprenoid-binding protein YceI